MGYVIVKNMYDVVYFVKETPRNEELRYSLRSLKNFPHRDVWFYGGNPGFRPDHHVRVIQNQGSKYDNVHQMLSLVCKNHDITEKFWLFNDDFFIMKQGAHTPHYRGDLYKYIVDIEDRAGGVTTYTRRLRRTAKILYTRGYTTKNYEMHIPMLFDREKLLKIMGDFSGANGVRSIYGNVASVGGKRMGDVKIFTLGQTIQYDQYLSSADNTWEYLRPHLEEAFPNPSPYEIE